MARTLYQKYRPNTFSEVIGQDKIINVLKNSIKLDKVNNTYLFNGPRGTGKTSLAKIFARAVNCKSIDNPLDDECDICQYFKSTSVYEDIYELDAASNNGVEDIRKIIDNCWFLPVVLAKKIYIIDEVHMLSKGAFNALLKTLEEPPEHAIFILATTEPNKIPVTILSRCQRFDLQRIGDSAMNEYLATILKQEKIDFEFLALQKITNLSDGCVRDALSLLQKVIINESKIDADTINRKLNISKDETLSTLIDLILIGDSTKVLNHWEQIYQEGINELNFLIQIQSFLKHKIIADQDANTQKLIKILYKMNDIEQRAVYTTQIQNIIVIALLELSQSINLSETRTVPTNIEKVNTPVSSDEKKDFNVTKNIQGQDNEDTSVPQNQKMTKIKQLTSTKNSPKLEVDIDTLVSLLKVANKELRIEAMKKFLMLASDLNGQQKYGLAKFFSEGNIRAVSTEAIIVTISPELIEPYNDRKSELITLLEQYKTIWIIDQDTWKKTLDSFMNRDQETPKNKKKTKSPEDNEDQKIIDKLSSKLDKKIEIME